MLVVLEDGVLVAWCRHFIGPVVLREWGPTASRANRSCRLYAITIRKLTSPANSLKGNYSRSHRSPTPVLSDSLSISSRLRLDISSIHPAFADKFSMHSVQLLPSYRHRSPGHLICTMIRPLVKMPKNIDSIKLRIS